MELFSEVYGCYYLVLQKLLARAEAPELPQMRQQIMGEGFGESMLYMIPKIESGEWKLFTREGKLFYSKINQDFTVPVSALQQSYLKALLEDPRIHLFLSEPTKRQLQDALAAAEPLWHQDDFYYFDRFADADPYEDTQYQKNFRTILTGIRQRQYVDIDYNSPRGRRLHHHYLPCRLEYSVKNDKFRLIALEKRKAQNDRLELLNLGRMQQVSLIDCYADSSIDINEKIQASYYKEPLRLLIKDKRNALERAMLHFANYEKNTTKIDDNTYECLIYYNETMETELLIEVMSFGPMLTVLGSEKFLRALRARLQRQNNLLERKDDTI